MAICSCYGLITSVFCFLWATNKEKTNAEKFTGNKRAFMTNVFPNGRGVISLIISLKF